MIGNDQGMSWAMDCECLKVFVHPSVFLCIDVCVCVCVYVCLLVHSCVCWGQFFHQHRVTWTLFKRYRLTQSEGSHGETIRQRLVALFSSSLIQTQPQTHCHTLFGQDNYQTSQTNEIKKLKKAREPLWMGLVWSAFTFAQEQWFCTPSWTTCSKRQALGNGWFIQYCFEQRIM